MTTHINKYNDKDGMVILPSSVRGPKFVWQVASKCSHGGQWQQNTEILREQSIRLLPIPPKRIQLFGLLCAF